MHRAFVWAHRLQIVSSAFRRHRILLRRQFKQAACLAGASFGSTVVVELDGDVSSMLVDYRGRTASPHLRHIPPQIYLMKIMKPCRLSTVQR